MIVQEFLRGGGTLAELTAKYALKARRHEKHANLVLLKYDQINSPMREQIVRECRGVILDEANNWNVVARPFDKFFNYGEPGAADIDWSTAKVQEKLDGSLCVLYHYNGEWHVATTGTPDGCGTVHGAGLRFSELFWRVFKAMGLRLPDGSTNRAFLFELTSPLNRIVVKQSEERLTLLAVRHRDGREYNPEAFSDVYPVVQSYPLGSFEDVLASFAGIDPLSSEGYVVVDAQFRRVKVKHPGYVALHHMKGEGIPTPRRALEVVLAGEVSEVLTAFPEFAPIIADVQARLTELGARLDAEYARIRHMAVQKDFALEAVKHPCSGALFQLRQGRIARAEDFLRSMPSDRLLDVLGFKQQIAEAA